MYGNKEVVYMEINNTIEWLRNQFNLAGISFNHDTLTEIDKTIKFSALCFKMSYEEIFYKVLNLIGNGDDVYEKFTRLD